MSPLTVRWTRRAVRRLDQCGSYIEQDNPAAAARVVARIVAVSEHLGEQPGMGRAGRIKGTYELVLADIPYIVVYRVRPAAVEILTIMHTAQQWPQAL